MRPLSIRELPLCREYGGLPPALIIMFKCRPTSSIELMNSSTSNSLLEDTDAETNKFYITSQLDLFRNKCAMRLDAVHDAGEVNERLV